MNRLVCYPLYELGGTEVIVVPAMTKFVSVSDGNKCILLWAMVPENSEPTVQYAVATVAYQGLLDGLWEFAGVCKHQFSIVHVFYKRIVPE